MLSAFLCLYVETFLLLIERQQICYCLHFILAVEHIGICFYLFYLFAESHDIISAICLLTLGFSAVNIPCVHHRFTVFLEYCIDNHAFIFKLLALVLCFVFCFIASWTYVNLLLPPAPPTPILLFRPAFQLTLNLVSESAQNFSLFWQCVASWVPFPRWYAAAYCSGAPLSTSTCFWAFQQ